MNNNITLNASMRSNLLSLRNISKQMDKTQLILATGKKVNSAIDNASAYYQARSLSNRAADLTALLDAMGQGIQTIEAATQGLTSGAEFLEQASAVVSEAASNVKYDFSDYTRVSTVEELKAAIADSNIDKIVVTQSLTFADNETITLTKGKTLAGLTQDISLNFSRSDDTALDYNMLSIQDGCKLQNITVNLAQNSATTSASNAVFSTGKTTIEKLNVYTTGYRGRGLVSDIAGSVVTGSCNVSTNGIESHGIIIQKGSANLDCNISITDSSHALRLGNYVDISGNFNIVGTAKSYIGVYGSAYNEIFGNFNIQAGSLVCSFGSGTNILSGTKIYGVSQASTFAIMHSGSIEYEAGVELYLANKGEATMTHWLVEQTISLPQGNSNDFSSYFTKKNDGIDSTYFVNTLKKQLEEAFKVEKKNYTEQYKKILEEYDNLLSDSSYQGINLLKGGKLEVAFNESRSNQYTVAGVLADSMSLGLETRDLFDTSAIKKSLEEITKAVNSIRSFQEELGNHYSVIKTRIDFTEALTDVLETGADDLTLADMNEASAEYLTLQTRQQLAINSLSLASQSARSVLSLF